MKILVALVIGVALALALLGAKNRHRFRYVPTPLAPDGFAQLAAREGFAGDEFAVEPGVVLRGLVKAPASGAKGWLLFLPGNGGDMLRGAQDLLVRLAGDTGLGLAVWAYRGFDGSSGTPSVRAFADDVENLATRLREKFGAAPERTHLVSFSLGTALSLRLAGLLAARGSPPASLVLLSPYDRIEVTRDTWWAPWSFSDVYDALAHGNDCKAPALLVHGELDDAVPITAARALATKMGARARLIELPGRGHVDWLSDESVLRQVRAFISEHTRP
jgi:hypothetical protein